MTKISQLPSDTPATGDYFPAQQVSSGSTKRFSLANLITLIFNNIPNAKITSASMNLTKSAADANGWIKRDYGNWQTYERTITVSSLSIAGNSNTNLSAINMPVGITDSGSLRFTCGILGGYGGRILASLENGNTTSNVTSMTPSLGNLTTAGISFSGYVYILAISV